MVINLFRFEIHGPVKLSGMTSGLDSSPEVMDGYDKAQAEIMRPSD